MSSAPAVIRLTMIVAYEPLPSSNESRERLLAAVQLVVRDLGLEVLGKDECRP